GGYGRLQRAPPARSPLSARTTPARFVPPAFAADRTESCGDMGIKTTWYLQSHLTCAKLSKSCIRSSSCPRGFPGGRAYSFSPDRRSLPGSHGRRPWVYHVLKNEPSRRRKRRENKWFRRV